ncbi:MAG: TIGR04104 family putative zinc finger protein [Bacillota bacterium]
MIQKCTNCSHLFTWKQTYKSMWSGHTPIKCEKCGRMHYITIISRVLFAISLPIPIFLVDYIRDSLRLNPLLVYVVWINFLFVVAPFLFRYKIKENE